MPASAVHSVQCPACGTKQDKAPGLSCQEDYTGTCISCGFYMKLRLQQGASDGVTFTVNGTQCTVRDEFNPATSLNEYLRRTGVSRGTKQLCIEGGCGVCLVAVKLYEPVSATSQVYAVNSCLVQLYMCDGWEITTIEGLGNVRTGLHAIQKRLTNLLQRNPTPTMQQVEDAYDVSICRCTGYRPILDAMKSFASDAPPNLKGGMIDIEWFNPNVGARAVWFKPTTLQELYTLLHQHRADNYRLVFGNSGFGVYKEIGPWMYDILIDIRGIQELYRIEFTPSLVWGANLTLTNIHDLCDKARSNASLPYAAVFAEHIKKVANNGVRNLASWAGNLMLKHRHPEFLSDIFTMLEVVGTRLLIGDETGNRSQCTLKEFLSLDMQGKVIEAALLPTYTDTNYYIRLYRVSQRLQADHGHVIAGFNMKIDKTNNCTVLQRPTIVFQGISGTLNRAENTEAFLEGKQLGDPQVLRDSFSMLNIELTPASDPLAASPEYRRSVATSFFYKYVLEVCGDKVAQRYRSGGASLVRPVSSANHSYDTRREEWPLNEPMTSIDADYLVSGTVRYLDDIPLEPNELHAALVISKEGNAEIASIDSQVALSLPGVYRFIQASDFPTGGKNDLNLLGQTPEEILSSGRVEYAGQPIGIIVAASMKRYIYILSPSGHSPVPSPPDWVCRSRRPVPLLPGVTEQQVCPQRHGGPGRAGDNPVGGRDSKVVAEALNIPVSSVNLEVERLGGAFGKITRNGMVSGACALAAYLMQRPVRLVMDLHTNMKSLGKRLPCVGEYEVGFTEEGKLNGIKLTYYSDCGCNDSESGSFYAPFYIDNVYFCPNWNLTTVSVKTNKPTNTACRAPDALSSEFMIEAVMEHIAKALNKDPTEIRKINFYQKGQANRWKKRGISLVPARYGMGWSGGHYSVFVAIYNSDGSIAIEHGGIDMGQGINTKVAQVCAYELGVPMSLITSQKELFDCQRQLTGDWRIHRKRTVLHVIQFLLLHCLTTGSHPVLSATQGEHGASSDEDAEQRHGRTFTNPYSQFPDRYNVYAAAVAEAEVDILTGQSQLNRVDILYDCGESLSPELDIGQVEGGFMMGLGCHLLEDSKFDPRTGVLLTDGTWEYKPPLPKDLPIDFRVNLLRNAPNPLGVLRSKATGEPPVVLSSSALFAIKRCVEAARAEMGHDTYFPLSRFASVGAACPDSLPDDDDDDGGGGGGAVPALSAILILQLSAVTQYLSQALV
ncbi:hypothetical protein C0Q70_04854 [Pomacea canaliculata]|uniref:FAD-binding PCMH-type domain-containing protein n=1 Tax=Pomacea canaliculata TaxID=400727 RepID=A0A2T7PJN1_POMCA|nr:hypothetical protein C0Q70_04854 [Pomacea canaliculata]